ncbi:hypothetical protein [Oceaniglobus ichthyenteri]|uniref:baeRF11 domain-containing protein n=1 Tax=Oceaniglobus ichthyenteri TaxID=2136177 RepID=UPI000D3C702D|nr:hypothetical protein [Oceaniglobus ichthyenteri]
MLYVDMPTAKELGTLNQHRADACVSIYLGTTPLSEKADQTRITLQNHVKTAMAQIETAGLDKRRAALLTQHFDVLLEDDDFWAHQAHSLGILATPDRIITYRLANKLTDMVAVSDRFHLKPLLRAVTFPQAAHVLAVSENAVRLVDVSADLPARAVRVSDMPRNAANAVGKASINDRSASGRIQGSEGQKVRLGQYIRQIDAALRPVLSQSDMPVILAATQPVAALVRAHSSVPLLDQTIETSPDDLSDAELATAARPILDAYHATQIQDFRAEFDRLTGQSRVTTDISDAARAATFGGIETLLVDFDAVVPGTVDDETGAVTFADTQSAASYGVVDEIAGRAMRTGARVLAVRKDDLPGDGSLAALLRYEI